MSLGSTVRAGSAHPVAMGYTGVQWVCRLMLLWRRAMFEVSLETVCFVVDKCREFQAKEAVAIPEPSAGPGDDWARQVLADHAEDLTLQELHAAFEDLAPAEQAEVVALMWIGRGDFEAADWEEAREEARSAWNPRTAGYILATPLAADYLEDGLAAFGYDCNE